MKEQRHSKVWLSINFFESALKAICIISCVVVTTSIFCKPKELLELQNRIFRNLANPAELRVPADLLRFPRTNCHGNIA